MAENSALSEQNYLVNDGNISKTTLSVSASGNAISPHTVDHELYTLCKLSGFSINQDVFKIILNLLRANVQPNAIIQVLKSIVSSKSKRSDPGPT